MSIIEIRKNSITDLDTDAVVNAANDGLWAGSGVCGAIFQAAGYEQLQAACNAIGHCDTGSAVITPGFNLKAKFIIHAVGPRWKDGKHKEPEQLYGAYYKSLELAAANNCRSIGFPLISAGVFGYPVLEAWDQAFKACKDFLDKNKGTPMKIVFAVLTDKALEEGRSALLDSGASRYKVAARGDWKTAAMPEQHETFVLQRSFTDRQMAALHHGNIPQEMEDKWFWYMEGDSLFAHRSWTGFCIYRIDFKPDNNHVVTVNRDSEQYQSTGVEDDTERLNHLLDWWTQDTYDYYNEWLDETVNHLKKSDKRPERLMISGREVDVYFFHKPEEPNGYLSNWYSSPFDLDGEHFSSVEQYIMYRKCIIFGDENAAKAILKTEDPAQQQAIGRTAKGYVGHVWAGMRQVVLLRGLMAKFSQNVDLKQKLLDTDDAYLVECTGTDRIWACGIRLNDDKRFDAANWTGDNILGFALVEVRHELRHV